MFAGSSEAVITHQFVFTAQNKSRGKKPSRWMIICDILGVRGCQSLALLPWKQDPCFEWSITAISSSASAAFLFMLEDSIFVIIYFSSPDDSRVTRVPPFMIIDVYRPQILYARDRKQGRVKTRQYGWTDSDDERLRAACFVPCFYNASCPSASPLMNFRCSGQPGGRGVCGCVC